MKYPRQANFIKTRELGRIISQFGRLALARDPLGCTTSSLMVTVEGRHLNTRKQLGVAAHAYNPSIWEVEPGSSVFDVE